ncbi:hypothetical protein LBMAG53_02890 [Planctomycetota bacterium]|nr:hypothetical protein LBMAG53_02890 [Planctomycetota bacterium]
MNSRTASGRLLWPSLLVASLLLPLLAGCAGRPTADDPVTIAAWWMEDRARGIARRSDELRLLPPDPGLERLAGWVDGDVPQLTARARRWPQLTALFATGEIVAADGRFSGLVAPRPEPSGSLPADAAAVADAENHDRRLLDALARSRLGVAEQIARWNAVIADIRRKQDLAAGATTWTPGN